MAPRKSTCGAVTIDSFTAVQGRQPARRSLASANARRSLRRIFYRMNTFDFLSPGGQPVLVCRLPNERGKGKPIHRYVHNETELQGFISAHDEPGYALYHAVAIFKEGAWRNKQNVEG